MKENKTVGTNGKTEMTIGTVTDQDRTAGIFGLCVLKTRSNIGRLVANPQASTWSWDKEGKYWQWNENFYAIGNWTTSFITGMALVAFKQTGDDFFLQQAGRLAPQYRLKVYEHGLDTMHDLGFLYSLYSVALYKLTGDKTHRETGLRAAEVLAGRYIPTGRFIRAWGRMDKGGVETRTDGVIPTSDMAIIDCMMNLPLLHWAFTETGERKFRDVAVAHADTTLANFIRADDSLFHAFRFDPISGRPTGGENYCGHSIPSHWARGTAWAIYGFALSYGYTGDQKYLDASMRLAHKFIANLDANAVPVWDFKLPQDAPHLRDSSAAAIAICGFQELQKQNAADQTILNAKLMLLERLCRNDYFDASENSGGLLKFGQVGRAANAYTSWGDYYFMEALAKEMGIDPGFW